MNIQIHSASSVADVVHLSPPRTFDVLSIRDAHGAAMPIDELVDHCRSLLVLEFDDAWLPAHANIGAVMPSREHVNQALYWVADKDGDILVHCHAGISRSSAMGYILACTREDPRRATRVLTPAQHWPNPLLVQFGAEALALPVSRVFWAVRRRIPGWPWPDYRGETAVPGAY